MAIFKQGTVFGKFTIVRLLGAGQDAEVYEVRTPEGARRALKILKEGASPASKLYARFVQECEIVATLEHVHVVRFFGAGVEQGRVWLLLELVAGMDLGRLAGEHPIGSSGMPTIQIVGRQLRYDPPAPAPVVTAPASAPHPKPPAAPWPWMRGRKAPPL